MAVSKTIAVILIAAGLCSVAVIGGVYALNASYNQGGNSVTVSSDYYVVDLMDSAGTASITSAQSVSITDLAADTVKSGGTVTYTWSDRTIDIGSYKVVLKHGTTAAAGTVNLKITEVGSSLNKDNFSVSYSSTTVAIDDENGVDLSPTTSGLAITLKYKVDGDNATSPYAISSNNTFKIELSYVSS